MTDPGSVDPEDLTDTQAEAPPSMVAGLIDELIDRQFECGTALLVAVAKSAPKRYRPWLVEEYAAPYMRMYLPIALECMRYGSQPDPAVLRPITDSSAKNAADGVPLLVLLSMVRAAIGAFGGYVIKLAGPRRMAAAIVVLGRAAMVSHDLARAAIDGYTDDTTASAPVRTPKVVVGPTPTRILRLAAMGYSTKEIARALHYSEQAVTYHLGQLMKQFGVPNRTALIARAVQQGAIELPDPNNPEDGGPPPDEYPGKGRRGA